MLEASYKLMKILVIGAFAIGGWVTGIQLTLNAHAASIEDVRTVQSSIQKDVKYILETVVRMDERQKQKE